MTRKIHKPEELVAKLRQVNVLVSQGQTADAICSIGVTEVTYYCWRKEFGGLKADQVKRLKDLETENARLRKAVADLTLDKLILKEAASGNHGSIGYRPPAPEVFVTAFATWPASQPRPAPPAMITLAPRPTLN